MELSGTDPFGDLHEPCAFAIHWLYKRYYEQDSENWWQENWGWWAFVILASREAKKWEH